MSLRRFTRPLGVTLSGLLAVAVIALVPAAAQAKVAAPTNLAPKGQTSTSTPAFTWNRVTGATSYELQISSNGNPPIVSTTTANNRWVPTANLPDGDFTWQVRANSASGNSSWSTADISISSSTAPSPVSPVGGTVLAQPDNPPLFTWSSIAGAVGYQVQVDNTGSWTSPTTYTTSGTSYFVSTPQATGTWYWRVRADRGNGYFTSWSDSASYVIGPLADPVPGTDMTSASVQDVSIDWQSVPGATSYQLQVGKDADFNTIVDDQIVYGTRFQPNLTYNNGTYYWRVRAIDAAGNRMPWTSATPNILKRNWPQAPQLEYPANTIATTIGDPLYFQWTPVPHATSYQLDISSDVNFSTYVSCYTAGTTYLIGSPPNQPNSCGDLSQGQTLYWRVRAIDSPIGVQGIYSSISKFIYDTGGVTLDSPANGDTVDVPTLTWDASRETNNYAVTVKNNVGTVVAQATTPSTSWTPGVKLDPSGNPYTWSVVSVDAAGGTSPIRPGRTFNVSGNDPAVQVAPLAPLTGDGTSSTDFPSLSWDPYPGAASYGITLGVHGSAFADNSSTSFINAARYQYPAATDIGTHYLSPGQYDWWVTAYDGAGLPLQTYPTAATFTITSLADVTGQRVSLDGNAAQAGAGCAKKLSDDQICTGIPATPTLSWSPVPGAAGYQVYLANEASITNLVTPVAATINTMWRPPGELPDNTASGSYYWYIRPCKSLAPQPVCNADPTSVEDIATNAFRKQSPPVALQTPANGSTVTGAPANAPLFTWTDYLTTSQAQFGLDGANQDPSYQAAKTYRIQISQAANFSTLLDDREVDQPFYSPSDRTLPQGTLYWRVQATDAASNRLAWSSTFSFNNNLPVVDLSTSNAVAAPNGGDTVSGSTPFRWTARDGAQSYTIEVYRNDTGTHSPGNLVFTDITREPTYVWQSYLPPSAKPYTWRVMWTDAGGQPRPWSVDGKFNVTSSALALTSPPTGTLQKNTNVYFTWGSVPLAANYRLDVRDANNNGVINFATPATAYAPSVMNDGYYTWRVTALDPSGGAMAVSAWRTFHVDATAPVVTKVTPASVGKPGSTIKVTFSEKVTGVTAKSIVLHPWGKKSKLAAKVKLSSNGKVATLTPKAKFKKGKAYTVNVATSIHDPAGNHLVAYGWSFNV